MSLRSLFLVALALLALSGCGGSGARADVARSTTSTPGATTATVVSGLRVSGRRLVIGTGAGRPVQLRGVSRSGTEYACEEGTGFFDSPTPQRPDSPALIAAMNRWDIDVVRVPLNEGCWLGVGAPTRFSGIHYRRAIEGEVRALRSAGLFVVLDLHWLSVSGGPANRTAPMPDAANSPRFWRSVARTFRQNPDVLFDLYNEPFGVSWSCWLDGCEVPAASAGPGGARGWPTYRAAGMQTLVNAVRGAGARQPLLVGGLSYALDLSGWLTHEPRDPDHDLVASVHSYGGLSPCSNGCLATVAAVAKQVPVVFGELGETDCASGYIDRLMAFADAHGIGYLGWAWDAVAPGSWSCRGGPALITSYTGTPTAYGAGLRTHLRRLGEPVRPAG